MNVADGPQRLILALMGRGARAVAERSGLNLERETRPLPRMRNGTTECDPRKSGGDRLPAKARGGFFPKSEFAVVKRLARCAGFKNQALPDSVLIPHQGPVVAIGIVSWLAEKHVSGPGTTPAAQFCVVAITAKSPQVRGALGRSLMGIDFKLRSRKNLPQRGLCQG
jgi:hypothetical protein